MGSCCTKKRKSVEIKTNDQNRTEKRKSPSPKNCPQNSQEYSNIKITTTEGIKRLEKHISEIKKKWEKDDEKMSYHEFDALDPNILYSDPYSEYSDDEFILGNFGTSYGPSSTPKLYPSAGSSFCMGPLTLEKPPPPRTILSIKNRLNKKVTS